MAVELGIKNVVAVGNKITNTAEAGVIKSQLKDITFLGVIPYSRSVRQADLRRTAVMTSDAEFVKQIRKIKNAIIEMIND
jgi:CO dehydrogenase nickel-insertion accessory protein CooC1